MNRTRRAENITALIFCAVLLSLMATWAHAMDSALAQQYPHTQEK